jgi:hypothetical protein
MGKTNSKKKKGEKRQNKKLARQIKESVGLPNDTKPPATAETKEKGKGQVMKIPMTVAGVREYKDYFGLLAKSVREKKPFWSLGFIPGPAAIPEYGEAGEVRIIAATPDVAKVLGTVPTPWMQWEELPEKIRQVRVKWKVMVDSLDHEPSPYNLGLARNLLEGRIPSKHLTMAMLRFRYRKGDPEKPFGITLLPILVGGNVQGLEVKVYNPAGIPDVPDDNAILTINDLKEGKGPVQKLLRTCALMENNYFVRYNRLGNRHSSTLESSQIPRGSGGNPATRQRPTW